MEKQNQVKRTLEQPSSMEAIRAILAASAKLCTTTAVEKSESAAHGLDQ